MKKRIRVRHSKAASKFAMFVGIAFCCIGFFGNILKVYVLKNKLDSLYNQGLITRDEYDEKRKQILNEI